MPKCRKTLSDKIHGFLCHRRSNEIIVMGNPTEDMWDKHEGQGFCYETEVKEFINDVFELTKKMSPSEERAMIQKGISKLAGDRLNENI